MRDNQCSIGKEFGDVVEYRYITPSGLSKSHFREAEKISDLDETRSIAETFEQFNPYRDNPDGTRNGPLKMSRRGPILRDAKCANDPQKLGEHNVSSRTQKQNIEPQGQSTNDNDQITSLPRKEEPPLERPLLSSTRKPSALPLQPRKKSVIPGLAGLKNAMKGITFGKRDPSSRDRLS
jgi:hypothetical protein